MAKTRDAIPTAAQTPAQINEKNREYWEPSWGKEADRSGDQTLEAPDMRPKQHDSSSWDQPKSASSTHGLLKPSARQSTQSYAKRIHAARTNAMRGTKFTAKQIQRDRTLGSADENMEPEEGKKHGKPTDQPISPTGIGSPSSHMGNAQPSTNLGPVGQRNDTTSHFGMAQDQKDVAPPGREEQVKKLKKKFGTPNAFKIAWSQYKQHHS